MTMRAGWRLVVLGGVVALGAAGCNTMEGLGEDVEQTGEAIEEEASD